MNVVTLLAVILPALVVTATSFLLIKRFLDAQEKKQLLTMHAQKSEKVLQLRLQAYERIMLMLERIRPGSLLFRVAAGNLSLKGYQSRLLENVREEFEHNFSQQIYMSPQVWSSVIAAREELVKLINSAAMEMSEDEKGNDLAQTIFKKSVEAGMPAIDQARDSLKNEVRKLF